MLSLPSYRQYGSVYFLGSLYQAFEGSITVLPGATAHTHDIEYNDQGVDVCIFACVCVCPHACWCVCVCVATGQKYGHKTYCLTDSCLKNTVAIANTANLNSAATKHVSV